MASVRLADEVALVLILLLALAIVSAGRETGAADVGIMISAEAAVTRAETFVTADRSLADLNPVAQDYGYDQSGYWVFFKSATDDSDEPSVVVAVRMRLDGSHLYAEHQLLLRVQSVADRPDHCPVPPAVPQMGRTYPRPSSHD